MMDISRRTFIRNTGIGVAGSHFLFACNNGNYSPWRYLTNEEAGILGAMCDQIIPEDDFPGAVRAGVIFYIDQRLNEEYRDLQETYRSGLALVESSCVKWTGKSITQLPWDEQTTFLKQVEKDQASSHFFGLVRKHTIEGYFGHPRHGGNKDFAGYRLVQFQYPELRGQNRYGDKRFQIQI